MNEPDAPVEESRRTPRRLKIAAAVALVCLLFFTQCVHTACMIGVACIPVIEPPSWYQSWKSLRRREAENQKYATSLNALQKAILQKDSAAIAQAIRAAPEQVSALTTRDESTLDLAVQMEDARAIALLLAAGADGLSARHDDRGDSPFAQALQKDVQRFADAHSEGKASRRPDAPTLLIEPFLATRKLDSKSPKSAEIIASAAESTLVFDRLLAYGIPFDITPDLLEEMIRAQNAALLQRVLNPTSGLDARISRWTDDDQGRLVRTAVSICRFDLANNLLDRGFTGRDKDRWVTAALRDCSGGQWFGGADLKTSGQVAALNLFLARVVKMGVALNSSSSSSTCPPWLGGRDAGSFCRIPDDAPLIRELIALGADPYLYLGDRDEPPVLQAWQHCDGNPPDGLLWTMLAATPGDDRRGVSQTFSAIFDTSSNSWCHKQTDKDRRAAAEALLAKGADVDGLDGHGRTALTYVLERDVISLSDAQWLVEHGASIDKVPPRAPSAYPLPDPKAPEVIAKLRAMSRTR